MTFFNLPDKDELEIQMQKRIAELEKANKELRAENIALNSDITKCRKAEEALRQSEIRYRMLHESMRDAFAQVSMDGRIIEFNDLYCKMLGYSPEEMRSLTFQELTPERWHAFEEGVVREQVIAHGYSDVYEKEYRRKDGVIIPVELRTILSRDESGRPNAMWAIVRDITERKRVEKALQKSEAELLTAQKIAQIGSWTWDLTNNEVTWSEQSYRNYGLEPGEVKPSYELFLSFIVPEDQKRVDREVQKAVESGHKYSVTYNIIRRDGMSRILLSENEIVKDESGKVVLMYGTNQDINERKKAEEALKKAHGNLERIVEERTAQLEKACSSLKESETGLAEAQKIAHLGNWEWDIATDKAYWSDEMYRIFGLNPQKSGATYDELLKYIHPDDRKYMDNAHKNALDGKSYNIEYRIIQKNGEERTVHMQSRVIFDEKRKPVRTRGIVQDITERKKAEEALANIETARKKEIHHRIKNNLQVISSLLDLQAEKFDNREFVMNSEVMEAFRESQDRVISMALIHEELHKSEGLDILNFSPYIEELAENLFQTYNLGNANISLNMDLEENIFFDMDVAVPLGIIINELVSNSLKHAFSCRDRGKIRIKFHREKKGECKNEGCRSTSFILTVSDDGIGLPENLDSKNPNTLGLQLLTSLVDQLDGELELKKNNGTEFTIRFIVTEKNNQVSTSQQLI